MKKSIINMSFTLSLLIIIMIIAVSGTAFAQQKPKAIVIGAVAPTFKALDFDEKEFDLNKFYKKQPIILNFFSVHCVSCLTAVNAIEKVIKNNNLKDTVAVIYVSLDDWKGSKKIHVPTVWSEIFNGNQLRVRDGNREIGRMYEVGTLPSTVMIDTEGKIFYLRDDYNEDFERDITKNLKKYIKNVSVNK